MVIMVSRYFLEAAVQEEPEALYQLGVMWENPLYGPPHVANARIHYQRASQAGHLPAMWELAVMHYEGAGVYPQCDHALALLRKILDKTALKERVVSAYRSYSAGKMGAGLLKYEMAADMGSLLAQQNAAFLYEKGIGTDCAFTHRIQFSS